MGKSMKYLSADADDTLQLIDPGCSYIVGGLVDRNRHKVGASSAYNAHDSLGSFSESGRKSWAAIHQIALVRLCRSKVKSSNDCSTWYNTKNLAENEFSIRSTCEAKRDRFMG